MKRAAGALFAIGFLLSGAASAAPDSFAAACEARGASAASCACQSKLAKASLDKAETRAAVAGMKRDNDGFQKAVAAMGAAKAERFRTKLAALGQQARQACP